MASERQSWAAADYTKRRLFNILREETQKIDYLDYHGYRRAFESIYDTLVKEWKKIQVELGQNLSIDSKRFEGYLLEALFYYACLKLQGLHIDAEILEMEGEKFEESPPWFEATPLYDIIAPLHHITERGVRRRKAPQTKADFLVTCVTDKGPTPPSLLDVKSRKPRRWRAEWGWQTTAALRRGFLFQLAYPKNGIKHPKNLDEWEIVTPCSNCKRLSRESRQCSECGKEIFPFTIADAYYEAAELWKRLGKDRKGRF